MGIPAFFRSETRKIGHDIIEFYEVRMTCQNIVLFLVKTRKYLLGWVSDRFRKCKRLPAGELDCGTSRCRKLCLKGNVAQNLYENSIKICLELLNARVWSLTENLKLHYFKNSEEMYMVPASLKVTADTEGQSQNSMLTLSAQYICF